jgi:hypothetical protein
MIFAGVSWTWVLIPANVEFYFFFQNFEVHRRADIGANIFKMTLLLSNPLQFLAKNVRDQAPVLLSMG